MINIKDIVEEMECDFCRKHKDGCVVQFADQSSGESTLCWGCLKKQAQMKMRSRQARVPKAEVKPANGVPPQAQPVNPK